MFYEFNSLEEFNTWHDALCQAHNILNEYTTAYTKASEVSGKWIAYVEDQYSTGLTETALRVQGGNYNNS
jgi:hypothetical protein